MKLSLKPKQSVIVPLNITYPASTSTGSYKVLAVVDSGNAVAESNKLDNVFASSAIQINVPGTTGPHFIVATLKSAPKVTSKSSKPYTFTVTYTAPAAR